MSLTSYEMHLIADIDRKIKRIENTCETAIFKDLITFAPAIKNILYSQEEKEID
ncbi:MAG: hypothetical protein K2P99_04855 [Burkholderiales bacterium]|nr:hypothetical protein [Burkholderiales bacterium]